MGDANGGNIRKQEPQQPSAEDIATFLDLVDDLGKFEASILFMKGWSRLPEREAKWPAAGKVMAWLRRMAEEAADGGAPSG